VQLCTIRENGTPTGTAAVVLDERGVVALSDLTGHAYPDAGEAIRAGVSADSLDHALAGAPAEVFRDPASVTFLAPIQRPGMVWGIGLNYREHAADLSESAPVDEPASFIKGPHTVIGPQDPIPVPRQSRRTTAEAELGLVFGREARNVSEEEALDVIWGVVPILDQTAEDILERNPRYLTRSKNFPGFLALGPGIVPMREVQERFGDIDDIVVQTVLNGALHRENVVRSMMFPPRALVAFHSAVFAFQAADIISTGTPGAVHVQPGDTVTCHIEGIGTLTNPVVAQGASGAPADLLLSAEL
jgi:2-keto-4-pentenoate hydratase/2-oxohepta-3-ene-1,7-dioic acid hydratase in catechol pathway